MPSVRSTAMSASEVTDRHYIVDYEALLGSRPITGQIGVTWTPGEDGRVDPQNVLDDLRRAVAGRLGLAATTPIRITLLSRL